MDPDERDPDLVQEMIEQRKRRARRLRHASAWDEPPDYYDTETDTQETV